MLVIVQEEYKRSNLPHAEGRTRSYTNCLTLALNVKEIAL